MTIWSAIRRVARRSLAAGVAERRTSFCVDLAGNRRHVPAFAIGPAPLVKRRARRMWSIESKNRCGIFTGPYIWFLPHYISGPRPIQRMSNAMQTILIAIALSGSSSSPAPEPARTADDQRLVCRAQDHEVGTHLRAPRVCKTRAEWAEERNRTQRFLREQAGRTLGSQIPRQSNGEGTAGSPAGN